MTEAERRRFHRFPFDASCALELEDGADHSCELMDLSINGALVALAADDDFDQARPGDLTLRLRGRRDRRAFEMVFSVRALRVQDGHVACRFVGTDPASFEQLRDLVADNLGDIELLDRELTQLDYWPGLSISPAAD
jgi:hypothetical protein